MIVKARLHRRHEEHSKRLDPPQLHYGKPQRGHLRQHEKQPGHRRQHLLSLGMLLQQRQQGVQHGTGPETLPHPPVLPRRQGPHQLFRQGPQQIHRRVPEHVVCPQPPGQRAPHVRPDNVRAGPRLFAHQPQGRGTFVQHLDGEGIKPVESHLYRPVEGARDGPRQRGSEAFVVKLEEVGKVEDQVVHGLDDMLAEFPEEGGVEIFEDAAGGGVVGVEFGGAVEVGDRGQGVEEAGDVEEYGSFVEEEVTGHGVDEARYGEAAGDLVVGFEEVFEGASA
mmetsp:Transcript_36104/g.84330  ORF Transcript_36104/g.84330 Transcript_36104/m.84330 type:complete len:279 (-) Transcript_36104:843-1679(-)